MRSRAVAAITRAHGSLVHPRRVGVLVQELARLLPSGSKVLDVGSGDGQIAALVLERRPDLRLRGIDVLARPDASIETLLYDGRTIPFPERAFDIVMLVDVLHHAEDCEALLAEAARVASSYILIKDHHRAGFAAEATLRLMDWVGNRGHGVAMRYRYLSEAEWTELFRRLDVRVETIRTRLGLYPPPFSWVFDRSLHFIARLEHRRRSPG